NTAGVLAPNSGANPTSSVPTATTFFKFRHGSFPFLPSNDPHATQPCSRAGRKLERQFMKEDEQSVRRGWRSFLCADCGHDWAAPTRDCFSPSGENCPKC